MKTQKSQNSSFSIITNEIFEALTNASHAYTFKIETPLHPDATFENFVIEKRNNQEEYHLYIYSYKTITQLDGTDFTFLMHIQECIDMENNDNTSAKMQMVGSCLYEVDLNGNTTGEPVWCFGSEGSGGTSSGLGGSDNTIALSNEEWIYYPDGFGTCTRVRTYTVTTSYETSEDNYGSWSGYYATEVEAGVACISNTNNNSDDNYSDPHFYNDGPSSTELDGGGGTSGPSPDNTSTVVTVPFILMMCK